MDINLLMKYVHARNEVANWLDGRPAVGLDVTDVLDLVNGFDYLGGLLADYHKVDNNDTSLNVIFNKPIEIGNEK